MWAFDRGESPPRAARLGITVSRKDGGAVRRNLFKRRVRDIFRTHKDRVPRGRDVLVSPTRGRGPKPEEGGFPASYETLKEDFLELNRRLSRAKQQ